jgi:hypothetical protein
MKYHDDPYALYAADDDDAQQGVCIKREGKVLAVPGQIHLYSENIEDFDVHRPFIRRNWSPVCNEVDPSKAKVCTWNYAVRAKFPIEFRLVANPGTKIETYVRAVRLFGNGDTLYAWDAPSSANALTIPSSAFKHGNVPYDVDADLQIVPIGSPISEKVLAETRDRTKLTWPTIIAQAAVDTVRVDYLDGAPVLKHGVGCFLAQAEIIRQALDQISRTVTKPIPQIEGVGAQTCVNIKSVDLGKVDELLDNLDKGLSDAQGELKKAEELLTRFQALSDSDSAALVSDLSKELTDPRNQAQTTKLEQLSTLLNNVRSIATAIRMGTVSVVQAYRAAIDSGKRLADDPGAQAKLFAGFTTRLTAGGGGFEERRANPEPDPSVVALRMRYLEHFQWFFRTCSRLPVVRVRG